jgi:hypothetical protein
VDGERDHAHEKDLRSFRTRLSLHWLGRDSNDDPSAFGLGLRLAAGFAGADHTLIAPFFDANTRSLSAFVGRGDHRRSA